MRRDKNDLKWQECKRKVFELDKKQCLLCQALTVAEMLRFQKSNPEFSLDIIDPAHHIAVSRDTKVMYNVDNVFSICRCHHERLDNCKDPITGKPCTKEDTDYWWSRIIKKRQDNLNSKTLNFCFYY